jgi:DNA repair exonuclease SbcCD ATPase subunit
MLKFKSVRWKNLLSTGSSFTEILLDRNTNTLVVGENGAGKSSVLDALCFVLYGKPFRKIKKDQLINSINGRDVVVEIEFEIYNKKYKIIRGIKPTIFEIYQNDVLLDQDAASRDYQEYLEKNILRMNMKSFTQIVILGSSSFVPFMQLPAGIRREVIEDLLDIRIFSTMSVLLKDRVSSNKDDILTNKNEIQNSVDILELHEKQKKKNSEKKNELVIISNQRISELQFNINRANEEIAVVQSDIDNLLIDIEDESKVINRISKIESLENDLESTKTKAKKTIKFYEEHDNCPTCTQTIDALIKSRKIEERQSALDKISDALIVLGKELSETQNRYQEISKINRDIKDKQYRITNALSASVLTDQREISILQKQISDTTTDKETETDIEIHQIENRLSELRLIKEQLLHKKELYELAGIILRDGGIKSRIIKQYIPIMNSLINKYLASMDFFVKFQLNESFEETILSRHRDDFTYDSFSEGEKMRIDLALLFTWRTIARMKNSANTNLLILDEVFDASLDANGCEEFLKLIHSLEDANVFVISHKGDILQDKFRSTIKFEKHKNFSRISL